MSNRTIYTVGHSTSPNPVFLKILNKFKITCIVDVRSVPFSRHAPQFNKDELMRFLKKHGIQYVYMGEEFGARREDKSLYTPQGYLDFELTRRSALFLKGIDRINKGLENGFTIALMCTEKQAMDCHRGILVGKGLADVGFEVVHIGYNDKTMTQEQLERALLNCYYPETNMFADQLGEPLHDEELIAEAYRRRNYEIGFRGNEDKEAAYL